MTTKTPVFDKSSLSNPSDIRVTHLDWHVSVDFEKKILSGTANYNFVRTTPSASRLDLDTSRLLIVSVADQDGQALKYKISGLKLPHLGQKLSIYLLKTTTDVSIKYETTSDCSAIQWLPPAQTTGKKHPYLFTQCQAIHARSLVPCQDLPGVKMTYTATVSVPYEWATCVMSAILKKKTDSAPGSVFSFEQRVPIPSYLLAVAVGNLEKRQISKRCSIWSEPKIIEAAAYEFSQTEQFLHIAETIAGTPYKWGRYDLLCLPPSCPYGGMENPCLTFVTPTLLAGDRSLADVVAHEIAHSWTGNLVTNASWDHFWLNEGWTTWFQRKIMARIHGDAFLDFDAIGGLKHLQDAVDELPAEYTKLVLSIGTGDPDDSYSTVSYEKGFTLLMFLERRVGTKAFEAFFRAYIAAHMGETITTEEFKAFFLDHFKGDDAVDGIDWETWFYGAGMPPEIPEYDRSLAEASEKLAELWYAVDRNGRMLPSQDISSWSSPQVTCFLDALEIKTQEDGGPLQVSTIMAMDKMYGFSGTKNSEILFRFCQLAVAAEDEKILPVVMRFITSQGRMKFVRPLYRSLFKSKMGRDHAIALFFENKDFYHPICAKMIASDLTTSRFSLAKVAKTVGLVALTAGLVVAGVWLVRSSSSGRKK